MKRKYTFSLKKDIIRHQSMYLFFHHSRVHVWDLSDGELSSNFSRDDSLCAGVREGPLYAVDGDSGVAPPVCQQVNLQETYHDNPFSCCVQLAFKIL